MVKSIIKGISILIATGLFLFLISKILTQGDYDKAFAWGKELIGLAGTLAGFLGITKSAQDITLNKENLYKNEVYMSGGIASILAGFTLLGVGSWASPIGLAAVATGGIGIRLVRAMKEN